MAKKKKDGRSNNGGPRERAGRKPDPVKKRRMTVKVPAKNYDAIKEKTKKLAKAYEEKCRREL